jgi:predicted branched-subunit amino acid permease
MSQLASLAMSVIVFSGTAQLAVLKVLSLPLLSIFATSLLLSLRFLPMIVALNPRLAVPRWKRVLISWTVVDASFALAARRNAEAGLARYLIGAWLCQYGGWVAGTLLGVVFGSVVPSGWTHTVEGLTVVIFIVLTLELSRSWRLAAAAVVGAGLALGLALAMPVGVAMVVAAAGGAALAMVRVGRRE